MGQTPKKVRRDRKEEVYRTSKYEIEYEAIKETSEEEIDKGNTPNISLMCRILGVKRANYYKWLHHEKSDRDKVHNQQLFYHRDQEKHLDIAYIHCVVRI